MTRDELVTDVQRYAKRSDAPVVESFLPKAESRIGRELRSLENQGEAEFNALTDRFLTLPGDYGSIQSLWTDAAGGPCTLLSVDQHSINDYQTSGSPSAVYNIRNGTIEVRPWVVDIPYTLYYYTRPSLPAGISTNAVLERWEQVYLYGILMELHIWERDRESLRLAVEMFNAEVAAINKQAARATADKPAARRA